MSSGVLYLLLIFGCFILALKLQKKKRKRRKKWSWKSLFKSKPKIKTRKDSWYEKPEWREIRDRRRVQNNRDNGLGKTKTGALILKCDRCGIVGTGHQIDHIYPRSKFPKLALEYNNTQTLCSTKSLPRGPGCNQKKSDKTDGYNWRRIRALPAGSIIAWHLRGKQVREGKR